MSCTRTFTSTVCECGGITSVGDINSSGGGQGGCCDDLCEDTYIVDEKKTTRTNAITCRSPNGAVLGGICYIYELVTTYECEAKSPLPPECSPPPPPPSPSSPPSPPITNPESDCLNGGGF